VRPYAALSVNAVVARRLAGLTIESRASELVDFANFVGPRAEVVALADALVEARSTPARIALRGKPGSGRRTVAAILAARAGRDVEVVASSASDLAQRLREVALRGHVPVVDLEELPADDEARRAAVRLVLGEHVGPLFVRAERDTDLPVTPTETVDFPMLSETERAACWRLHLGDEACADALAERYAIGAGAIARAAAATDPIAALRASRGRRIARMAERVERLASWENLVVTPDVDDALHELVARVRFRRTVLETWGMGDVATTARGVTALFQGGPGTGKTMAAGVIAKALGYELWRVDLSKVVSKWIGETERNLGMLFDAAEEGEIVLLFDEADALFTKRTEVKSSNDKHANAATNYLLQRLDSFTGIAILTTNFGTAIDAAFRRRLAVHIEFPFPDEQERLRLWRAHLPKSLPTRGDLQLQQIAETYQLSGGYIRNAALRAAYLAAGRAASPAITADDLRRAIALEKERIGKLGNGRIE
jgi:broad-specificity NMP kinase